MEFCYYSQESEFTEKEEMKLSPRTFTLSFTNSELKMDKILPVISVMYHFLRSPSKEIFSPVAMHIRVENHKITKSEIKCAASDL